MGVYTAKDVVYAFIAPRLQTSEVQSRILRHEQLQSSSSPLFVEAVEGFEKVVSGFKVADLYSDLSVPKKIMKKLADEYFLKISSAIHSDFSFDDRQLAIHHLLQSPHSQDFLKAAPIEGLGQKFSAREFRVVLQYRLMISIFSGQSECPCCRK